LLTAAAAAAAVAAPVMRMMNAAAVKTVRLKVPFLLRLRPGESLLLLLV
jgi:hypothetical protein